MKKVDKYLIIGLGNPGDRYASTRHNVGFRSIDRLHDMLNVDKTKNRFGSQLANTLYKGKKVILAKPMTFMNNSGIALKRIAIFYRIKPSNIIVIFDDMDISLGKIKIKKKGSGGSHNGMKSIISHIKTYDFPRIRIGIGKPDNGTDVVSYVLGTPDRDQMSTLVASVESAAQAAIDCVDSGLEKAMQKYN